MLSAGKQKEPSEAVFFQSVFVSAVSVEKNRSFSEIVIETIRIGSFQIRDFGRREREFLSLSGQIIYGKPAGFLDAAIGCHVVKLQNPTCRRIRKYTIVGWSGRSIHHQEFAVLIDQGFQDLRIGGAHFVADVDRSAADGAEKTVLFGISVCGPEHIPVTAV